MVPHTPLKLDHPQHHVSGAGVRQHSHREGGPAPPRRVGLGRRRLPAVVGLFLGVGGFLELVPAPLWAFWAVGGVWRSTELSRSFCWPCGCVCVWCAPVWREGSYLRPLEVVCGCLGPALPWPSARRLPAMARGFSCALGLLLGCPRSPWPSCQMRLAVPAHGRGFATASPTPTAWPWGRAALARGLNGPVPCPGAPHGGSCGGGVCAPGCSWNVLEVCMG